MVYQNRLIALVEQVFRHDFWCPSCWFGSLNPRFVGQVFRRKSQEAIQRFKERCENMPSDYLETFSVLWDIDYE